MTKEMDVEEVIEEKMAMTRCCRLADRLANLSISQR